MKVYWTAEARARLLAIHTYIAEESPMVARDVTARLLRRSQQLAVPPLLGRRLPEYPRADLRELLVRPFRIIYLVKAARIEIVTVKHYRQNLPRTPEQLKRRPSR
jgi:toxin ParE1/3/4